MTAVRGVVIGIGNEYRRDDGVGRAVIDELRRRPRTGVELVASDGDPAHLLEVWDARPLAVVVDAVLCEPSRPGTVHRTTARLPAGHGATSSHGLGIPEAVRLAEALGRAPRRLVVYAVEAAELGFGRQLSPSVAEIVGRVADSVAAEFSCTSPQTEGLLS